MVDLTLTKTIVKFILHSVVTSPCSMTELFEIRKIRTPMAKNTVDVIILKFNSVVLPYCNSSKKMQMKWQTV